MSRDSSHLAAVAAAAVVLAAGVAVFHGVPAERSTTIDVVELADPAEGSLGRLRVSITNRSDRTLNLVGMEAGCACRAASGFPLRVAAGERGEFLVLFRQAQAAPQGRLLLWTDWEDQPWLELDLQQKLRRSRQVRRSE